MSNKKIVPFYITLTVLLLVSSLLLVELVSLAFITFHVIGIRSRDELKHSLDISGGQRNREAVEPTETGLPSWMQAHILHPYTGFVRNPQLPRQVFNNRVIHIPVNEFGFFGRLSSKGPSDDRLTVAITGGSVALELFLYAGDALRRDLEKSAQYGDRDIDIVCLALGGMKQPQQLMALNYFLAMGYHIDLLINCDGFNEVALPFAQNIPYNIHPFFPRAWGIYVKKAMNMDVAILFSKLFESKERLELRRGQMSKIPFRHSSFCLFLWHMIKTREDKRQIALDLEIREILKIKKHTHPQETGPSYNFISEEEIFSVCVGQWKRSSLQMWKLCKANQIDYMHCLQPNQYLTGSKPLSEWERKHAYAGSANLSRKTVEMGYPGLIDQGRDLSEQGLPFYDLTELFKNNRETLYRDNSCHYNDRGYELLAQRIAQIIVTRHHN